MLFCKIIIGPLVPEFSGYMRDARIYNNIIPNSKIYKRDNVNCPKSEINIFIERPCINIMNTAKFNLMMINHELFDRIVKSNFDLIQNIDIMLAKTKLNVDILLKYKTKYKFKYNIYYTKFTTNTNICTIKKDYNKIVHFAGRSPYKMTDVVIRTWVNNIRLPKIIITCFDVNFPGCLDNVKRQLKKQNIHNVSKYISKSSNITLYDNPLSENIMQNLKNKSGCYICPSYLEGYGHYINEGRSKSAIIITTDAPPMNELINKSSGILIPCDKSNFFNIGRSYGSCYINENGLLYAIKMYMNMTENQKIKMGINAQKQFIKDTKFFNKKMNDLYLYFTKNKKIQFKNKSFY